MSSLILFTEGMNMYERLLSETQHYLERNKDDLIHVKVLWKFISAEGKKSNFAVPSLTDFSCLLDGDKRFEFVARARSTAASKGDLDQDLLEHEELGKLGFKEDQYVRLRKMRLDDDEEIDDEEEAKFIPLDDDIVLEENQDEFEDMFFPSAKHSAGKYNSKKEAAASHLKSAPSFQHNGSSTKNVLKKVLRSTNKTITLKKTSHKKRKK
jgi:hypothetical protein